MGKKGRNEKKNSYKVKIKKLSLGVFDTLTDICLFTIFFHLQSYKIAGGKDLSRAINRAVHLTEIVHQNNLERLLYKIKSKGYLEKKQDYYKITKLGQERLKRILPIWEEKRPWDGTLYLITYDIPEDRKKERDNLRDCLKRLSCAMLQQSVWLTPYNPKRIIADFVKENNLISLVLVSELREGSSIGGQDILAALSRMYKLNEINNEYLEFINAAKKKRINNQQLIWSFLSILKKDPQLPFELLPSGWWGKKAYKLYQKLI